MEDLGYTHVEVLTMLDVGRKLVSKEETFKYAVLPSVTLNIFRISHAEIFDEFEEWNMIQAHYCLVLATIGSTLEQITLTVNK